MTTTSMAKTLGLLCGVLLVFVGIGVGFMGASVNVSPASGRVGFYFVGIGIALLGLPLVLLRFSASAARVTAILPFVALSAGLLWAAFAGGPAIAGGRLFQACSVIFSALVMARIYLQIRARKSSVIDA